MRRQSVTHVQRSWDVWRSASHREDPSTGRRRSNLLPWAFIELGTGVLYGLTLETLTIFQLHAYQYGHFLIMFGPVPLAIAVGWGIILYSAMAFADALALPAWAAPALVGLLGLNIDLSMDAIAIRLQMWQWHGITSTQ